MSQFRSLLDRYVTDPEFRASIDARMERVASTIREHHPDRLFGLHPEATDGQVVIAFNDHPLTSRDEIVAVMRASK